MAEETTQATPEQATQVAYAGAEAAATAPAPERQTAAERAIARRADELGMKLDPAEHEAIAKMTIQMLEAQGAFDQPPPVPAPAKEAPENSAPEPPEDIVVPPRKKTFAEKYVGK